MVDADDRSPQEWLDTIDRLAAIVPGGVPDNDLSEGLAYAKAGDLAHALVRDLRSGQTSYFDELFAQLELLLVGAGALPELRDLLVVGLVEDIQNVSLNSDVALDLWEPWLGVATREGWNLIMDLWDGKVSGDELAQYVRDGRRAK